MAEFLSSAPQTGNTRKLLLIGLVVALALATGFALFYHHENHAPLQATATRVLTLPLHTVYGSNAKGGAAAMEAPETEDSIYVIPLLRVENTSDVPLFIKDVTSSVTLQDGRDNPGRRIGARDRERLQAMVPGITPLVKQTNLPPLDPEGQVAPHSTAEGYAIFLYTMPSTEWDKRKAADVRLDFYHQDAATIPLPK
ncbi:hypothetical protein [Terriglobus aquaticus]|uniref:Uncharacterized protein n=1 Tax=Terriglobus aquaticus TaxID=940139 RepID=A0ABW9KHB4_9BACT|nr:hypothetical protein [Terriglobus aquaticus]